MALKRSAEELFHLHKRSRTNTRVPPSASGDMVDGPPPPSPPDSPFAESSTACIRREAVEDFKKSSEFWDLVAAAEVRGLVEGFYACRGWINFHHTLLNLSRYTFSLIPRRFRYPPPGYLEEAEAALERRAFEEATQREDGLQMPNSEEEGVPAEEDNLFLGNDEVPQAIDWVAKDDDEDDDDEEEEKKDD